MHLKKNSLNEKEEKRMTVGYTATFRSVIYYNTHSRLSSHSCTRVPCLERVISFGLAVFGPGCR